MTFIHLTIPYVVTAASRPRVTRYGTFYGKNYTAFRTVVGEWLDKLKPTRIEGHIKATIIFTFPIPKSYSKKKRENLPNNPMTCKPDLDNCIKALTDILTGRYYQDDSQITEIKAKKIWGLNGEITITIDNEE